MTKLTFEDLTFKEENDKIRVNFLKLYFFYLNKKDLKKKIDFIVEKNSITFKDVSEKKVRNKFNLLLQKGFNNLKNSLNNKKTIYIHKNSGIPLMGTLYFGIIDKGSNMIEIRPNTSCNLNCIFCSVDEGISSRRLIDYVVEKKYLIEELKKVVEFKQKKSDVYINPQGEPLLYADIIPLVKDISKIKNVNIISIITNAVLLTKSLLDELIKAGLNQINISINAFNAKLAKKLAGTDYNLKQVLEITKYASKKIDTVIAPVLLHNINEKDAALLVEFAKNIKAKILIQNFLYNKKGRNPVKQLSWSKFYTILKDLEGKYSTKLIIKCPIVKTKQLPLPFKRGDVIKAKINVPGRNRNEKLAVAHDRVILIPNYRKKGYVRVKIKHSKNNIFLGELVWNKSKKKKKK